MEKRLKAICMTGKEINGMIRQCYIKGTMIGIKEGDLKQKGKEMKEYSTTKWQGNRD